MNYSGLAETLQQCNADKNSEEVASHLKNDVSAVKLKHKIFIKDRELIRGPS